MDEQRLPPLSLHAQERAAGRRRRRHVAAGGSERSGAAPVRIHRPDLADPFLRPHEKKSVRTGKGGSGDIPAGGRKQADPARLDRGETELRRTGDGLPPAPASPPTPPQFSIPTLSPPI